MTTLPARTFSSALGVSRTIFGVGCLFAPSLVLRRIAIGGLSPEAAVMFGVREIAIGDDE
ncbi:hypothetical protein B0T16DRAFT_455447 [Cercophora newfieldiana]|uniref:Uncharacterized protein n=1 Tax=Cercophora newfieldiana TaxID=92897 RepID=A0AA40CVJ6_9PEZI|nr:hypothetical protein B0T16DRAFT_455447 [Cercophora newfieldiana]